MFEYLEKYQINGENIGEDDFAKLVEKVEVALEQLKEEKGIQPTIFEVETAIAFEYFKDEKCDVVLLETGMGGDMDATNVCKKVLGSVLVSISLDHMGFLGDTIEEIAYHKAGIIKSGCPVVVMDQSQEVMQVVEGYADEKGSKMYVAGKTELPVGLKGQWQQYNAGVAVKVMEVLREQGYEITEESVVQGLKKAKWPGRFEKISEKPLVIIDGAHNPDAAKRLRETLDKDYKDTRFVYVMGVLGDKDFAEVIKLMADRGEYIITLTPPNPRALESEKLAEAIREYNSNVQWTNSIEEAYDIAISKQKELSSELSDGLSKGLVGEIDDEVAILAYGSLSYLGRFKEICKENGVC